MTTHAPDDGALVDVIPRIATSAAYQQKLMVYNPVRLYWPQLPAARDREGGRVKHRLPLGL